MPLSELEVNYELVSDLQSALSGGKHKVRLVPATFMHACGEKDSEKSPWKHFRTHNGNEFRYTSAQFAEFVDKMLNCKPKWIERCIIEAQDIAKDAEDKEAFDYAANARTRYAELTGGKQGGPNNPWGCKGNPESGINRDNVTIDSSEPQRGNATTYALRKLRKDAPEIHAEVLEGGLSPHAGMIKAGFRKRTITLPEDPEDMALAIVRRLSEEDLDVVISILVQGR